MKRISRILAAIIVLNYLFLMTTTIGDEYNEFSPMSGSIMGTTSQMVKLAKLNCAAHGGPDDASEMVYWHDIPSDASFMAPSSTEPTKYLSFELDSGKFLA